MATTPDELTVLEQEVLKRVVGTWKSDVGVVHKAVLMLASEVDGHDMSGIVDRVLALLDTLVVPTDMDSIALESVGEAHEFGRSVASQGLGEDVPKVAVSKNSKEAVAGLSDSALAALQEAKDNLSRPLIGGGLQGLTTALAPLIQNPAKIERSVSWATANSANSAISKISLKTKEPMTIIPERDSCVHCQAYAGVKSTLTGFPTGLTFGSKPLPAEGKTLPHPPFHPRCRCVAELGITDEYAATLKREAVRSILRGTKLPSESDKVRLDAAKRLLESDPVAPESVKKYAKKAVKNSKFS